MEWTCKFLINYCSSREKSEVNYCEMSSMWVIRWWDMLILWLLEAEKNAKNARNVNELVTRLSSSYWFTSIIVLPDKLHNWLSSTRNREKKLEGIVTFHSTNFILNLRIPFHLSQQRFGKGETTSINFCLRWQCFLLTFSSLSPPSTFSREMFNLSCKNYWTSSASLTKQKFLLL